MARLALALLGLDRLGMAWLGLLWLGSACLGLEIAQGHRFDNENEVTCPQFARVAGFESLTDLGTTMSRPLAAWVLNFVLALARL